MAFLAVEQPFLMPTAWHAPGISQSFRDRPKGGAWFEADGQAAEETRTYNEALQRLQEDPEEPFKAFQCLRVLRGSFMAL